MRSSLRLDERGWEVCSFNPIHSALLLWRGDHPACPSGAPSLAGRTDARSWAGIWEDHYGDRRSGGLRKQEEIL